MEYNANILFNSSLATIVIGFIITYLVYKFSIRNHSYWKKRGVPYIKPYPFIGSLTGVFNKNFEESEIERYNKYGRLYGLYEGNHPKLVVNEPALIKNILVKDFQSFTNSREINSGDPVGDNMLFIMQGDDWKRVRTIVSPTFSTGKIKRIMSIFQDCAKTLVQNFKTSSTNGEPIDVLKIYGAFTMDVIASSAFSTKINSHNDPENNFVKKAKAIFGENQIWKFILFLLAPEIILKIFKIGIFESESMSFFKKVTLEIIEERRKTGKKSNDFLQLLMDAATEGDKEEKFETQSDDLTSNYGSDSIHHPLLKQATNKHLSMDELVAQCVVFFVAGYHTTATTLGIVTYFMALNQDCQDKLHEEVTQVINQTKGEITYEAIQKMKYLDNCISEALRLYPAVPDATRTATLDYKLGDTGILIPKGMVVEIPFLAMHRDPEYFPHPDIFDPERFNTQEKEKQVPYSFLPFGAGPRNCVGMRFALVELKVCLVHVFSTFHVQRCPETKVPLEISNGQGVLQPLPIKLRLTPREICLLK